MMERGSTYEEKYLTEDEISGELLADTLYDVPDDADSDSGNDSDSSVTVTVNKVQTKVTRTMKH
jgi:hypothetical protein